MTQFLFFGSSNLLLSGDGAGFARAGVVSAGRSRASRPVPPRAPSPLSAYYNKSKFTRRFVTRLLRSW